MTDLNNRKDAFEKKFAHDAELQFRAEARACKLFGLWLAPQLGLEGAQAEAYAKTVVGANLAEAGFDDVKAFVRPVIAEKGLNISEHVLDVKLHEFVEVAKKQLMDEAGA